MSEGEWGGRGGERGIRQKPKKTSEGAPLRCGLYARLQTILTIVNVGYGTKRKGDVDGEKGAEKRDFSFFTHLEEFL